MLVNPDGSGGFIALAAWQLTYGIEKLSDAHAEIPVEPEFSLFSSAG